MSSVAITGNASGAGVFTIASPNSASSFTATLPAATTTLVGTDATQTLTNKTLTSPTVNSPTIGGTPVMGASLITSGTAVASTSGTSIDFTGIPSWVKRITVMFSGVSTSGSSLIQLQLGDSGGVETTSYTSGAWLANTANTNSTTGLLIVGGNAAAYPFDGNMTVCLVDISTNKWSFSSTMSGSLTGISTLGKGKSCKWVNHKAPIFCPLLPSGRFVRLYLQTRWRLACHPS